MNDYDFRRMRWLMNRLPDLNWNVSKKKARAERITTVITGMPRGGGTGHQFEDAAIDLASVREAYQEVLTELEAMRAKLKPLIDRLEDPNERAVMRMRYLQGYKPPGIARAIYRTERSVFMYLNRAERHISEMTPE